MTHLKLLICIALLATLITLNVVFKFTSLDPDSYIDDGTYKWSHLQEVYKKALVEDNPSLVAGQLRWKKRLAEKGTVMRQVQDTILNLNHQEMKSNYVVRRENEKLPPVDGPKKILFFNDFVERYDFHFGEGSEPFVKAGCPQTNCFATSNRSLLKVEDADAIVWNQRSKELEVLPQNVSRHTRLIYFMMESPNYLVIDLNKYGNLFNYTMTYTHHSDIFNPYGIFVKRKIPLPPPNGKNYAAGKTKLAVWFTSFCETADSRISLGHNLQEFISIDIFGKCGEEKYPKEDNINPDETLKAMEKEYKFYLSFENSLCKNYITEKFFKAIRFDIVPVVFGLGPYDTIAPPHSYINVLDFESVESLAEYLLYLDSNDTAYNEYFWWKPKYESLFHYKHHTPDYNQMAWCQLCDKLNSDFTPQTYRSIAAYHSPYNQCLVGGDNLILRYTTREREYRKYSICMSLLLSALLIILYKLKRRHNTSLP